MDSELAQEVLEYFRDNLLVMLAISFVAGFAAFKSVAWERKGNPILFFVIGVVGAFVGLYGVLYLNLKPIFEALSPFRFFLDLLASYAGCFVVASIVHFIKPH